MGWFDHEPDAGEIEAEIRRRGLWECGRCTLPPHTVRRGVIPATVITEIVGREMGVCEYATPVCLACLQLPDTPAVLERIAIQGLRDAYDDSHPKEG